MRTTAMLPACLLGVVTILVPPMSGIGSAQDVATIGAFQFAAQNKSLNFSARLKQIDELGNVKVKDPALTVLKESLGSLLESPNCEKYEEKLFRLQVITAIGNVGPDASSLASRVANYYGDDPILDGAIATTLLKIRPQPITAAPQTAAQPAPAVNVSQVLKDLADKTKSLDDRVAALAKLNSALKAQKRDDVDAILKSFVASLKDPSDFRFVVAYGLKAALDAGAAAKVDNLAQYKKDAVMNLIAMLDAKSDDATVGAAIAALGSLKADAADAVCALKAISGMAGRPLAIRIAANDAVASISAKDK